MLTNMRKIKYGKYGIDWLNQEMHMAKRTRAESADEKAPVGASKRRHIIHGKHQVPDPPRDGDGDDGYGDDGEELPVTYQVV